jgi:hypothetical protein
VLLTQEVFDRLNLEAALMIAQEQRLNVELGLMTVQTHDLKRQLQDAWTEIDVLKAELNRALMLKRSAEDQATSFLQARMEIEEQAAKIFLKLRGVALGPGLKAP